MRTTASTRLRFGVFFLLCTKFTYITLTEDKMLEYSAMLFYRKKVEVGQIEKIERKSKYVIFGSLFDSMWIHYRDGRDQVFAINPAPF